MHYLRVSARTRAGTTTATATADDGDDLLSARPGRANELISIWYGVPSSSYDSPSAVALRTFALRSNAIIILCCNGLIGLVIVDADDVDALRNCWLNSFHAPSDRLSCQPSPADSLRYDDASASRI